MNTTPRAAAQLQALEPGDVTTILDHLHELSVPDRASQIEIETPGGWFRCFVARHKDGSLVLLSIAPVRQRITS